MKIIKTIIAVIIVFTIWLSPVIIDYTIWWQSFLGSFLYMPIGLYVSKKFMDWFDSKLK